jgi:hypothetical protein
MAARSVGTLKSLYMKIEKEKNLIIAIVKRHGGLDFLKLPSVKCNRSVGKELLSNVFLFHRQVDTIGY